jgi:hypothetical protein
MKDGGSIFDWQKASWDYRLPVLIGLSLAGHILCFYLFHVVYPPTTSLLPPAAQVSVLNPKVPEDRALLAWVDVNNPASVSQPDFRRDLVKQLAPRYRPSFAESAPAILPLKSPTDAADQFPSLFQTETLSAIRRPPAAPATPFEFKTRIDLEPALQNRAPCQLPTPPAAAALVEPTTLFVGVGPDGKVEFAFLHRSSGSDELDRTAEIYVQALNFAPAVERSWGLVHVRWGSL